MDWKSLRITPLDLAGNFEEGYIRGTKTRAGRIAAEGTPESYARAASTVMPYDQAAATGYLKLRDYEDDRAYGREASDAIVSGDYKRAASTAAQYGRADDALTFQKTGKEQATQAYAAQIGQGYSALQSIKKAPPEQRQQRFDNLLAFGIKATEDAGHDASVLKEFAGEATDERIAAFEQFLRIAGQQAGMEFPKPQKVVSENLGDRLGFRYEDSPEMLGYENVGAKPRAPGDPNDDGMTPGQVRKTETDLRKEFIGNSKEFIGVRDSFAQIKNLSKNAGVDPAADIAFIFSYMKMLDPGSVVREGEYATAKKTASIPDQLWNAYVNAKNGTTLSPKQVADFTNQARTIYQARLAQHQRDVALYRDFATGYGVNPEVAVPNLALPNEDAAVDADAEPDFIRDPKTGKVVPNPRKQR